VSSNAPMREKKHRRSVYKSAGRKCFPAVCGQIIACVCVCVSFVETNI